MAAPCPRMAARTCTSSKGIAHASTTAGATQTPMAPCDVKGCWGLVSCGWIAIL